MERSRGTVRAIVTLLLLCCASSNFAQDFLFSFLPGKWVAMSKTLVAGGTLTVAVDMKPGERLVLQRCGTDRCNVAEPVANWTSSDFTARESSEVKIEGGRYHITLFAENRGIQGELQAIDEGATVLRYESGTSVRLTLQPAE